MNKKDLKIVFLGNPEFAKFHLERILNEGYRVVAVVSAPNKAAGRGLKVQSSAVAEFARSRNLPLLQPTNLKDSEFLDELRSYQADIQIVIAFRMLPEIVWSMPPMGTVNLHASLLPQYRGAAPINWAIINGEKETGVSSFLLKHEIDTGNLLVQLRCSIEEDDTAASLHDKLMSLGADAMVQTLQGILDDSLNGIEQSKISELPLKPAPKIYKDTCLVDWNQDHQKVHNLIRGLSPYPTAYTDLQGIRMKIFESKLASDEDKLKPGELKSDGKEFIHVGCKNGAVALTQIQVAGKKRMLISDFLRGYGQRLRFV